MLSRLAVFAMVLALSACGMFGGGSRRAAPEPVTPEAREARRLERQQEREREEQQEREREEAKMPKSPEIEAARAALAEVEQDSVATAEFPADLQRARTSLAEADRIWKDEDGRPEDEELQAVRHHSYMAKQRAAVILVKTRSFQLGPDRPASTAAARPATRTPPQRTAVRSIAGGPGGTSGALVAASEAGERGTTEVREPPPVDNRQMQAEIERRARLRAQQREDEDQRAAQLSAEVDAQLASQRKAEEARQKVELDALRRAKLEADRRAEAEAEQQAQLEAERRTQEEATRETEERIAREAQVSAELEAQLADQREQARETQHQAELQRAKQVAAEAERRRVAEELAQREAQHRAEMAAAKQQAEAAAQRKAEAETRRQVAAVRDQAKAEQRAQREELREQALIDAERVAARQAARRDAERRAEDTAALPPPAAAETEAEQYAMAPPPPSQAPPAGGWLSKLAALQPRSERRGLVLTVPEGRFAPGRTNLQSGSDAALAAVAEYLVAHPGNVAVCEGYSDVLGEDGDARAFSAARARAVQAALLKRGIDITRVWAVGYGDARPLAGNETAEGRRLNRRVEIVIQKQASAGG